MVLHNLSPAIGSRGKKKRKGRGQGSGKGGTSTKGHKGQQSRSGYRIGGEGGQTKIEQKTPKSYFKRNDKDVPSIIKTDALIKLAKTTGKIDLTRALLVQHGLVKARKQYKILLGDPVDTKINVHAFACSAEAQKTIEAQGGKIIIVKK